MLLHIVLFCYLCTVNESNGSDVKPHGLRIYHCHTCDSQRA